MRDHLPAAVALRDLRHDPDRPQQSRESRRIGGGDLENRMGSADRLGLGRRL